MLWRPCFFGHDLCISLKHLKTTGVMIPCVMSKWDSLNNILNAEAAIIVETWEYNGQQRGRNRNHKDGTNLREILQKTMGVVTSK